jgi:ketosteroid isomerase-like protein
MDADWSANARSVLDELQAKVTARDLPGLRRFFEDPAVLIGTAGDGRTPEGREAYLAAVVGQRAAVRWEWRETLVFYEATDALGFAAFGDIVLIDVGGEVRAPIRATFFAVRTDRGWRLREFHGSIAQPTN